VTESYEVTQTQIYVQMSKVSIRYVYVEVGQDKTGVSLVIFFSYKILNPLLKKFIAQKPCKNSVSLWFR